MKQLIVIVASVVLGISIATMILSDSGLMGSMRRVFELEPRSRMYEVYDR